MLAPELRATPDAAASRCSQLVADKKLAASVAALLRTVGSKPRLAILLELCGGELSVRELLLRTCLGASSLSQHLGMLRRQDLVRARRRGTSISYAISSVPTRLLLEFLSRRFGLARTRSNHSPGIK